LRRQLKAATLGENLVAEYPWRMPDSSLRLGEPHVSQGIDDDTGHARSIYSSVEVTERISLAEPEVAARVIAIREMGVLIALDDFGTGYASMSYLLQLPFDTLKIDRSFVSEVTSHSQKAAIVRALTGLAHDLGVIVVAEGVETQTELALIAELGCD
jgi:EAL domain-containing protein (putative c-di-GMP-specific phosphodiesterase class I)